jgi:EmrB/QacA subfamily drug resistance transporter
MSDQQVLAETPPSAGAAPMRLTAMIVASALFMQNLDSTVIATALPAMARAFGADPVHMSAALTSYLLSLAVFIPASGWMADRFGARTVFRAAIGVFTLGSVLCGEAGNFPLLIAARILQGTGGAMMVPVGRLLLLRTVAKSELVAAMAWLTVPAMLGPVIGPPLGGMIVSYASWRWIFYINVPIGLLGILLVTLFIADVREEAPQRFDGLGLLLSAVCLAGAMFGFETIGRGLVSGPTSAALVGLGAAAGLLYLRHARIHASPVLDLTLFRIPSFGISVASGSLFRIGVGAVPFLLPLMIQLGFGRSAAQSGAITFAAAAGALVMKPATQFVLRRFGFRVTLIWNGTLAALLLGATAALRPSWPLVAIYALLLTGGFFRSLQFTAYNTLAYADIPRPRMSAATSLYSTVQQISLTFGVAAGAAALEFGRTLGGHRAPDLGDFSIAFLVVAGASLLAIPLAARLAPDVGAEMSGQRVRGEARACPGR